MRLPFSLLTLAAAILVDASSSIRNPIGALSTVQNATIHTRNNRVTALSEFELSFNIRDDLHVKFQLEPNHDILSNDASVSYLAPDGTITRQEKAERLDYKVFKGSAWVRRPSTGETEWTRTGWARAIVRRDGKEPLFEGAFSVWKDHHHISGSRNYQRIRHRLDPEVEEVDAQGREFMVLWRDSDILEAPTEGMHQELRREIDGEFLGDGMCGSEGLTFNFQRDHPVVAGLPVKKRDYGFMDFSRVFKRQLDSVTGGSSAGTNLVQSIGSSAGCPTTRKVALVGVATDCTYTASFGSPQDARENIIDQMNRASAVWEDTFQISLGLQNITLLDAECPGTPNSATEFNQACSDSVDIQARLNMFSAWRGTQPDDNSHWTLLSTCATGSAVGLAWLGQACVNTAITTNSSFTGNGDSSGEETVSGANVVVRTNGAAEWQVIAHETGHTYGAVHDCTSSACADQNYVAAQQCCPLSANTCDAGERYIMNPSTANGITDFSPCSVGNICSAIGRRSVNTDCLSDNRNVETITGQQCGNGIVEPGEDCDCGGEQGCADDPCCDASTCRFANGAVCDDTNEDCCNNCQFASAGTVCRASTGDCDPQETCPGDSGDCPADTTQPDGEDCGDGLQCTSGQCTSRDQQCKSAMGSYTQGNDTHSCDSQGCVISCASPEFGPGVCYGLQQNFLDGTECGGGGHCDNGVCRGSTAGGQIRSWIDDHRAIVIGVATAVGVLVLIIAVSCIRSCFKRRKRVQARPPPPPAGGWQGWNSRGGAPPPMAQRGGYYPPPPPPPVMSGARGGGWDAPPPPPPTYTRSRYA